MKERIDMTIEPSPAPPVPVRRRNGELTSPIPVRFHRDGYEEVRRRAADDGQSVSSWIREAVQNKLDVSA